MAITAVTADRIISNFTGIAASGTQTIDTAVPTDMVMRLEARVFFVQSAASHLSAAASMRGSYVLENKNGVVSAPAAITGSANPDNSGGLVAADAEASDIGGTPTANWTISGTNARLTITNTSASAADACVIIDTYAVKNV